MGAAYDIVPPGRAAGRWVLTPAEMAEADRFTIETLGVPGIALMENAARHVAAAVAARVEPGGAIAIICGGGNNGGDGLAAARHLVTWGYRVRVGLTVDPDRYRGDARVNYDACVNMGVQPEPFSPQMLNDCAHVVDAVLGTGLKGDVRGAARAAIEAMHAHEAPVLAVDVPSGVDGLTGRVRGVAVRAAHTVTFSASKPGHWLHPGAGLRGRLRIVDIGMPDPAVYRTESRRWVLDDADLAAAWRPRDPNAHKGRQGHVYVLGGTVGRTGAVRMSADAALRAGAGLATIGTTAAACGGLGSVLYEIMAEPALDRDPAWLVERLCSFSAVAVGPGLPTDPEVGARLASVLPTVKRPMVIDADGLNHAVRHPAIVSGPDRIITPHPGEAARLLGSTSAAVQGDRVGAVRRLAELTGATVVLKGAHTLVCAPDGLAFCPAGNPGMATAGMGDVLTGVIAALLARGLPAPAAARAGVLWHARAGDRVAAARTENHLLAGDVIGALADVERDAC